MDSARMFQVTIGDPDTGAGLDILAVAQSSLPGGNIDPNELIQHLKVRPVLVGSLGDVQPWLALLAAGAPLRELRRAHQVFAASHMPGRDVLESTIEVEEGIVFRRSYGFGSEFSAGQEIAVEALESPIVPFESSPLELQSLFEILRRGAALAPEVGIGTYVGVVAAGQSPLVLLTVPIGIILVAAAIDSAKPGRRGAIQRFRQFIGIRQRKRGSKDDNLPLRKSELSLPGGEEQPRKED